MPHTYQYPRPSLTVDPVIFGLNIEEQTPVLRVLLIKRADDPFKGKWAIPGGFVEVSDEGGQGESIDDAARRELEEETGIKVAYMEQLYTFGTPGRDPRGRVISIAYMALVRQQDYKVVAGSDAADADWFSVEEVLWNKGLAFDHWGILEMAVKRLQGKVRYAPIGFNLLPPKFTLKELQKLYELILMKDLDKGNFRKRILAMSILAEAGVQDTKYRASKLYRFDKKAYDKAVKDGFNFEI